MKWTKLQETSPPCISTLKMHGNLETCLKCVLLLIFLWILHILSLSNPFDSYSRCSQSHSFCALSCLTNSVLTTIHDVLCFSLVTSHGTSPFGHYTLEARLNTISFSLPCSKTSSLTTIKLPSPLTLWVTIKLFSHPWKSDRYSFSTHELCFCHTTMAFPTTNGKHSLLFS